eukprot:2771485-Rhodomonas_salina.1
MNIHPLAVGVQEQGCRLLSHLTEKGSIGAAAGIDAVVKAMRTFLPAVEVQEQGCRLFSLLAEVPDNPVRISNAGGIEAVVGAMTAHLQAAGVQKHGCRLLASHGLPQA